MTFDDLNLNTPLRTALAELGLTTPTTIQQKVFPIVMSGRDVCGIAQTGTGKTFAYLLPCLRQWVFSKDKIKSPQILILVPTRELAAQVVKDLRAEYPDDMCAYSTIEFSTESRIYWLLRTRAGIAIGYAALLGLIVGMVITAQTLYSATAASAKEFAILLALGIPRRRIMVMVLTQSFWVGIIGILCAYPICLGLREIARLSNTDVDLRWEITGGTALVTIVMALGSGLFAMRSVRKIEPMDLLR